MGENTEKQRGKPFQKGADDPRINRGGRPKGYNAFRKAFRGIADNEVIREKLLALITGDNPQAVVSASKLWLEYGWGRAPAAPEDNDALRESGNRLPPGLTAEQVIAIARGDKPE